VRVPDLVKTLEEAWQMLQKAATHNHEEVGKGNPAWPGPLAEPSVHDIAITAQWLAKELPTFEDMVIHGPGMYLLLC